MHQRKKKMSLARQKYGPPARFSGPADAYQATDVREYFKAEYGKTIVLCR